MLSVTLMESKYANMLRWFTGTNGCGIVRIETHGLMDDRMNDFLHSYKYCSIVYVAK